MLGSSEDTGTAASPPRGVPATLVWLVSIAWRVAFLVVVTFAVVLALARVRVVVLPVIVALLLTTFLAPPARWLERHRLPPLAATWVSSRRNGPATALLVALLAVVIQNVEGNLLQPLIMGKVIKLHPVVILLSVTTAATLAGIAGAFLAVPVVATAVNIAAYFKNDRRPEPDDIEARHQGR